MSDNLNFSQGNGFGQMSWQDLAALQSMLRKDLTAGYGSPATSPVGSLTGGQPLIPQSIEATLAFAAADVKKEVKLWPRLVKTDIFSSVHEFTRVNERGLNFDPFILEGSKPAVNAGLYERLFQRVKYLGDLRRITDQMAQMRILGGDASAVALEDRLGTQSLLLKTENALFWGDSRSNAAAFDGLIPMMEQLAPANIFDLRGANLTEERIKTDLAQSHEQSYVAPDLLVTSYTTQQILSALRGGNQFYVNVNGQANVTAGVTVTEVPTSIGPIPLEGNLFLRLRKPGSGAVGTSAPAMPGGGGAPAYTPGAPGPGETSLFAAADQGNYRYRLVAVGPDGRSAPADSGAVPVAAGQKVTITVGTGGETGITYFEVYRSAVGGVTADATFIGSVAYSTAGATTFTDLNDTMGGTTWALAIPLAADIYKFVRLLDLMRRFIPFPGLAIEFAILLFGAPLYQVPTKFAAWKNVGQTL